MLRTPLCHQLGIAHPIFSVGMGGLAGPELVAVVSNAGACGVLGAGARPAAVGCRREPVQGDGDQRGPAHADVRCRLDHNPWVEPRASDQDPTISAECPRWQLPCSLVPLAACSSVVRAVSVSRDEPEGVSTDENIYVPISTLCVRRE